MPNAFNEGTECTTRVRNIAIAITIINMDVISKVFLKLASAFTFLSEKKCLNSIILLYNYPHNAGNCHMNHKCRNYCRIGFPS